MYGWVNYPRGLLTYSPLIACLSVSFLPDSFHSVKNTKKKVCNCVQPSSPPLPSCLPSCPFLLLSSSEPQLQHPSQFLRSLFRFLLSTSSTDISSFPNLMMNVAPLVFLSSWESALWLLSNSMTSFSTLWSRDFVLSSPRVRDFLRYCAWFSLRSYFNYKLSANHMFRDFTFPIWALCIRF